jgi:hypothetical protein
MTDDNHYNIYENLQNDFEVYSDLLDVGCGKELKNLLDFDDSSFQSLIGIDKKPPEFLTLLYDKYLKTKGIQDFDIWKFNESAFGRKFKFCEEDILSYDYKTDHYGLIICTSVLHFYCDRIKHALISSFYKATQKKGLIFIRLNHSEHPDDTNSEFSRKICHNIYQSKSEPNDIRYLIDKDEFIERMKVYSMLEKHTLLTRETVTIVIQK